MTKTQRVISHKPQEETLDKAQEKTEAPIEWTEELFGKKVEELCMESGYRILPEIVLVPTNHGTFELAVKTRVIKA